MENQYNNDRQPLKEHIDYGRIQNVEQARLMAHATVEKELNRSLTIIFVTSIVGSVLIILGLLLLVVAGVHYIWG